MTAALVDAAADIPNEDYHRLPSLSSSGARLLLPPSCPALFKWERDHPVYKDVFDFGSAAHKKVLGDPFAEIVIFESPNWLKKADQTAKREARESGLIPLLRKEFVQVEDMAAAILAHPIASVLFDPASGKPEQSLFWTDEQTGVECRVRLDWLPYPIEGRRMILPDYKTADCAEPKTWARSAANFGYPQQAVWYMDGVKACGLDPDPVFLFVIQERDAPYLVSVVDLDPTDLEMGRQLNRQALRIFADCLAADVWPGYSTEIETVTLPAWYSSRLNPEEIQ